ncbi:MAG TPA: amidohydrolase family protein [Longimicrobiaceae bacterium]|nr:amidohydrolase family protein [Longimicrobiaceae bacterium]
MMLRRPLAPTRPPLLTGRRAAIRLAATLLAATTTAACTPSQVQPGAGGGVEQSATGAAAADMVAFVDVNVIPMDRERVLERQTVVVRDGRIAEIGPAASVRVPVGAQRIEGNGQYLMPGIAEMHAHIPSPQAGEQAIENTLFLYLAGGVTTIRGMLGHPHHLELRERAARNAILSPRIYTSGPSFNGNSAPSPEVAERMVREQKEAGYDLLKVHPGVSRPAFDAMVRTAHQVEIPFAGHVPADAGLQRALEARYSSIDHLDGYVEALAAGRAPAGAETGFFGSNLMAHLDESRIPELARATREAGVWNVPTQTLIEHLMSPEDPEAMIRRPEMRYMPPQTLAQWAQAKRNIRQQTGITPEDAQRFIEVRRRLIKALHDAGAGLLLGSDAPQFFNVPGFSMQHELPMMVDAGLSPYQTLEMGTRNPAVFFGAQNEFGTVEVGRSADLVLLEANPLQDIRNFERRAGVMVRGRWLPQSEIQQRLDAIAAAVAG